MKYYTGVGSRATPKGVVGMMTTIAITMANKGYALNSGGAQGADSAFENGCDFVNGNENIYIPWNGFNNKYTKDGYKIPLDWNNVQNAEIMLKDVLPYYDRLKGPVKRLHLRNVYQVLGDNLNTSSEIVICYTERGTVKGGTATAIRMGGVNNAPILNLGVEYIFNNAFDMLAEYFS